MITNPDVFDPVKYSLEECAFLLDHIGEPPVVALQKVPKEVIVAAVKPVIQRIYELIELTKHDKTFTWIGVQKVKDQIKVYLEQQAKWQADKLRYPKAPRFPSMHSYDAKNRPHRGGTGSDSGRVRTYFDADGNRHEFAVDLLSNKETGGWAPEWANKPSNVVVNTKALIEDPTTNRIECPVCQHTESFNPESRGSYNAARARMSKHLRTATANTESHRELHTNEFGA